MSRQPEEEPSPPPPFYHPGLMDISDPKPHPGSRPIEPGSPVQKMGKQYGSGRMAFVHIRDEGGNHQQVFKAALRSKREHMSSQEDSMRWSPEAGEAEM